MLVACTAVAAASPVNAQRSAVDLPVGITIEARPIAAFSVSTPDQRRFGSLEYLGGLELKSSYSEFGGFSAIRVAPDGEHFVSLSDKGRWLTARIVHEHDRPIGIADATMAPMLGPDGRTLAARGWFDTESLAERDGWFYVGIERVNRIVRFDFARQGVLARAEVVPTPAAISHLPYNKGLEALTFAPRNGRLAGALMAFSERGLDANGDLRAFLIGGAMPGEFSVKRRDNFDISDSVTLPSGDVLLLERRFTWWTGIAMRLRRIAIADIAPGAQVDGTGLLFADLGYQIDNMEGLSVHVNVNGDTVLTLISDDNFSILQRTVLLQFKLAYE
ncbi:MAG TPA: esterase-like activity of phytase family protein [Xanthobacteraceae bacterium]|nr:esterase-like activity of phytase family protein [Xanthobacteraceae bacterium]